MAGVTPSLQSNAPIDFEERPEYVQALHRGLEVIRAFDREHFGMTLSEVAERTSLSRATARRLLLTLEHLGYMSHQGRRFSLTPRILDLGFAYISSLSVAELALPLMQELGQELHESCSLAVLEGHDIIYVQRVAVRKVMAITLGIGARLPAYCASMGRVLAADLDQEARNRWLSALKPEALTRFTLTDKKALRKELDRVRARGYAYVEQELEEGLCSIAVPVRDASGRALAALNVGMPFRQGARARAVKQVLPALRAKAQRIERSLPAGPKASAVSALR
jgi:IclR family transcriptional regulator, pca regulon regulatory protein